MVDHSTQIKKLVELGVRKKCWSKTCILDVLPTMMATNLYLNQSWFHNVNFKAFFN